MKFKQAPGINRVTSLLNGKSVPSSSIKSSSKSIVENEPDLTAKWADSSNNLKSIKGKNEAVAIVCFCHLRWNFVFQRPQHLMTRFAKNQRVFYFEEPLFENIDTPFNREHKDKSGVNVIVPVLPHGKSEDERTLLLQEMVNAAIEKYEIDNYVAWYYTPMSLPFTRHLAPMALVYDCMDELSGFKFAPASLLELEQELMAKAQVMFTGGMNLYEYKKTKHSNVHGVPSSIDRQHFEDGLAAQDPADQKDLVNPRAGFYGVIDERMNLELLGGLAKSMPDWNFVILGPVVKIDPATLPQYPNLHYLGSKDYNDLPAYLGNWDVALLPFALNESTKFISPTKTPEYLSAMKPVVSTSIIDVVNPYGNLGLVNIADTVEDFSTAIRKAYKQKGDTAWRSKVDKFLSQNSWDKTWDRMNKIILKALAGEITEPVEVKSKVDLTNSASQMLTEFGKRTATTSVPEVDNVPLSQIENKISSEVRVHGTLMFDYLIVGAGFAGSTLAERLANEGKKVLIIDKRDHIGGNAYDCYNEDGIMIHKYGPHIFHTNSAEVFNHLGKFTKWRSYEHRVLASVDGLQVPMPINLDTINKLYGYTFNASQLEQYFESVAEKKDQVLTSEDVVVGKVGRELYEKFFRGYTRKQWDMDPSELNASVTARVPTRTNRDDRYFTDVYQAMPLHGYTKMFQNMLAHPNIKIMLNTDYKDIINIIPYREMIYSGPVDEFFNHQYGKLPYRSLEFVFETHDMNVFQKTGTVNYPNEHPYTRISEFKYLTGQIHHKTSVVYEYPRAEGDPYYPVPKKENFDLYKKYEMLAESRPDVHFVGRLATYKYYNMDQVVAQALTLFKKIKKGWSTVSEEKLTINGKLTSN